MLLASQRSILPAFKMEDAQCAEGEHLPLNTRGRFHGLLWTVHKPPDKKERMHSSRVDPPEWKRVRLAMGRAKDDGKEGGSEDCSLTPTGWKCGTMRRPHTAAHDSRTRKEQQVTRAGNRDENRVCCFSFFETRPRSDEQLDRRWTRMGSNDGISVSRSWPGGLNITPGSCNSAVGLLRLQRRPHHHLQSGPTRNQPIS